MEAQSSSIGTSGLFGPVDKELVESVKRGLLRLAPMQYRAAKLMLAGKNRPEIAIELNINLSGAGRLIAVVLKKCECTRHQFARACMELDSDPEVREYLAALPARHGRFRAMFAKD